MENIIILPQEMIFFPACVCMCVLTCLFSLFAVTLLDSMSALADLGWEAYPNEGVSAVHTHIHINAIEVHSDYNLQVVLLHFLSQAGL